MSKIDWNNPEDTKFVESLTKPTCHHDLLNYQVKAFVEVLNELAGHFKSHSLEKGLAKLAFSLLGINGKETLLRVFDEHSKPNLEYPCGCGTLFIKALSE